nr:9989_t:CDS:2 [Entrophospora candida]
MKHLAAYLLLTLAGKTPDAKSIKALLKTVGIEAESAPVEDTKEEEKEESDDDMGFGLFD